MTKGQGTYLSYLLRLWRVSGDEDEVVALSPSTQEGSHCVGEKPIWRASVESSHIGGRRAFATLGDLFSFLRGQTGEQAGGIVQEQPGYQGHASWAKQTASRIMRRGTDDSQYPVLP